MAITCCVNGHYYDDGKHLTCPHCRDVPAGDDEKTVAGPLSVHSRSSAVKIVDLQDNSKSANDEKTVGIYRKKHGHDPVTGWLVCMKGPERGRDYRLHSGRNFLGRAPSMDIAVTDDAQISREGHLSIVFEPVSHTFLLAPGSANTYLNGEAVTDPVPLADSDVIGAGESEFIFVPFCSGERTWESVE